MLKEEGIPKLKEELPILSDEVTKKDIPKKNEVGVKSELEKDKNDFDNSAPPVLLPNSYDNKDTPDAPEDTIAKEKVPVKSEKSDTEADVSKLKDDEVDKEVLPEKEPENMETNDIVKEKLDEPIVSEIDTKINSEEEKPVEEMNTSDKIEDEKMEIDTVVEKMDVNSETKNEEEMKEDEETDIETDVRKEEEEQKEEKEIKSETPPDTKTENVIPVSITEEQENEDKKYDCDTDTETKYDGTQTNEKEDSLIKKEQEKGLETVDKAVLIKSEDVSDDLKERFNIHKMLPKDVILSPHIDDSQVNSLLELFVYLLFNFI